MHIQLVHARYYVDFGRTYRKDRGCCKEVVKGEKT